MSEDHLIAQRDALKQELAELQKQIAAAERAPIDKSVLNAGIEQAERDHDALTSPALEDLREEVDRLSDGIEDCWIDLAGLIRRCDMMADRFPAVPVPGSVIPALTATVAARVGQVERLAAADIGYVRIVELPPFATVAARSEGDDRDSG
jgi:hypothetical protein